MHATPYMVLTWCTHLKNPCTQTVQAQDACTCKHRPRVRGRMHVQACTGRMQVALQFTHAAVWQLP